MFELKQKMIEAINTSGLGIEQILFVVKDLFRDVEDAYQSGMRRAAEQAAAQPAVEKAPPAEIIEEEDDLK